MQSHALWRDESRQSLVRETSSATREPSCRQGRPLCRESSRTRVTGAPAPARLGRPSRSLSSSRAEGPAGAAQEPRPSTQPGRAALRGQERCGGTPGCAGVPTHRELSSLLASPQHTGTNPQGSLPLPVSVGAQPVLQDLGQGAFLSQQGSSSPGDSSPSFSGPFRARPPAPQRPGPAASAASLSPANPALGQVLLPCQRVPAPAFPGLLSPSPWPALGFPSACDHFSARPEAAVAGAAVPQLSP